MKNGTRKWGGSKGKNTIYIVYMSVCVVCVCVCVPVSPPPPFLSSFSVSFSVPGGHFGISGVKSFDSKGLSVPDTWPKIGDTFGHR